MTSLQRQFLGFLATPFLWKENQIKNLQQFDLQNTYNNQFNVKLENNYRLGKLVERFVSEKISGDNSIVGIASEEIEQQVYFKAQLFVPFADYGKNFPIVNNDCIVGFYIYPKELKQFSDCKFYIPTKHNWLIKPYEQIDWLNFDDFTTRINVFLSEENNPLCWMKKPNGEMVKFFVVSWGTKRL